MVIRQLLLLPVPACLPVAAGARRSFFDNFPTYSRQG
jgi:hypothetical protein